MVLTAAGVQDEREGLLAREDATGSSGAVRGASTDLAPQRRWRIIGNILLLGAFGGLCWFGAPDFIAMPGRGQSASNEPPPAEPVVLTEAGCVPRAQLRLERPPDARDWLGARTVSPRLGFVFGCTGKYSTHFAFRCVAAIESLVLIGGWSGPVYLIADSAACFDERRLRDITGNEHVRVVADVFGRLGADVAKWLVSNNAGGRGGALKALMHEVIPSDDAPEILVWHDADHVFAAPGCIARTVRDTLLHFGAHRTMLVGRWPKRSRKCTAHCGVGGGGRRGDGVHIGTLASHRDWSRDLNRAWLRRLIAEPTVADNILLYQTVKDINATATVAELPSAFKDKFWNAQADNETVRAYSCVNHVSGGRCAANTQPKHGPHKTRLFFNSLCLPKYTHPNPVCKMPPGSEAGSALVPDAPTVPTGFATRWCDQGPDQVELPDVDCGDWRTHCLQQQNHIR